MALNPRDPTNRLAIAERALTARPSVFSSALSAEEGRFREVVRKMDRQVAAGELTPQVAARNVAAARAALQESMARGRDEAVRPSQFSAEAGLALEARRLAREADPAALAKETASLLRQLLIETTIANRRDSLVAKTTERDGMGNEVASIGAILALHASASQGGDQAAAEYARRRLEDLRHMVAPSQQDAVAKALHRPGDVDDAFVEKYLVHLGRNPGDMERFELTARQQGDASALAAWAIMARRGGVLDPEKALSSHRLSMLEKLPDATLAALQRFEAQEMDRQRDEAAAHFDQFAAVLGEVAATIGNARPPAEGVAPVHPWTAAALERAAQADQVAAE